MKLVPSDTEDFAYTVPRFRVGRSGIVRVKLVDGSVRQIQARRGDVLDIPVRRLFRTGTTARDLNTALKARPDYADLKLAVPYASEPNVDRPGPFDGLKLIVSEDNVYVRAEDGTYCLWE